MPNTNVIQQSFVGGEMSPLMFGRISDAKYQAGAAAMRNFITMPQGPAKNRPGFAYVNTVKNPGTAARLIPFTYSTDQTMVIELGAGYFRFHSQGATLMNGGSPYEISNSYAAADIMDIHYVQSNDVMTLVHPTYPPAELRRNGALSWAFTNISFEAIVSPPTGISATASCTTPKIAYSYVVTSIASDGVQESVASASATCTGNLLESGAFNIISWSSNGSIRYQVYKLLAGAYGYIGASSTTSIVDDNVNPDMSVTPPIYDPVFQSAGNYPGAVSYYEQRRSFAGTINDRSKIWMTKNGTESDMSYGIPVRDNDRVAFSVAALQANFIRHIIPLGQALILLTSAGEWRVTSINTDALTPTSISVKPQSYIGAAEVQPVIVNNSLVYVASRGGHVRELGYAWQAGGFVTGDLSVRADHLFDGRTITDMTHSKAPWPIVWMVSSTGELLGLTYVPEQEVGAWHRHDTDGSFESCCCVAEGNEDVLYVIVRRTINGSETRYIERMASRMIDSVTDAFFVDSGSTFDGWNTGSTTVTVSGGTTWDHMDSVTITASSPIFSYPATTDIGDVIVVKDSDGKDIRLQIRSMSSTTQATAIPNNTIPVTLIGSATASWGWARDTITGLTWLEGKTVSILTDGAVHPQRVVTGGAVSLQRPSTVVHVGLPYDSDLKTLPAAIQMDGLGQGHRKNVNRAWVRVSQSSGIFVGPDEYSLTRHHQRTTEPMGSPPDMVTDEIEVMTDPAWQQGGQVLVRQRDPLPLTVISMTLELSVA